MRGGAGIFPVMFHKARGVRESWRQDREACSKVADGCVLWTMLAILEEPFLRMGTGTQVFSPCVILHHDRK